MLRPDSHQQWSGKRSAKAYMGIVGGGGRQASLAVDAPERLLSCAAAANIVVALLPPSDRRSAGERLRTCTRIGPGAPADDREYIEDWRRHYNEDRYTRPWVGLTPRAFANQAVTGRKRALAVDHKPGHFHSGPKAIPQGGPLLWGQISRSIKAATIKRGYYGCHEQLIGHLQLLVDPYNHAQRLRTL
jgi:hypothetical protein